ncbi:rolling circle replication protein, Rep63 protein, partial [Acinetobacter baumannii]
MPKSLNLTKAPKILHFDRGVSALSEGSSVVKSVALGKLTKSQAKPENKGFQSPSCTKNKQGVGARLHSYILQDQSAKLLPQERVCNC